MQRKRLIGFFILAIVGIGVVSMIVWMTNRPIGRLWVIVPPARTSDMIVALREGEDGSSRIVSISADGTIREPSGGAEIDDREFVWDAKGDRVIFVSNRAPDGSYQLFDWIPDRDNNPFQLTLAGASRSNPWFVHNGNSILFASRGAILRIDYQTLKTSFVYPPKEEPGQHGAEAEEGGQASGTDHGHRHDEMTHLMEQKWQEVSASLNGDAFDKGFVTPNGSIFVGIYSTQRGRVLVLQELNPADAASAEPRVPFMAGEIEVAMHPTKSMVVVAVRDWRYINPAAAPEEFRNPDGTIRRPYVNALYLIDFDAETPITTMFQSNDGSQALMYPAISPNGEELVVSVYAVQDGSLKPDSLVVVPIEGGNMSRIVNGEATEPSWSANGDKLAFIRGGDVYTVRRDGTELKNLTRGKGFFSSPKFSPKKG